MNTKSSISLIVLFIITLPLLFACAPAQTVPQTAKTTETAKAPQVINITYATAASPESALMILHRQFCKKVEEASAGRIKIDFHPGGAFLKQTELKEGVKKGVCNMALIPGSEQPGDAPFNGYIRLPLLGMKSWAQAEAIYRKIFYSTPELQNDYTKDGLKTYAMRLMIPQEIQTKQPVSVPGDIKGKKLFATQEGAELVKLAGGAPVFVAPGEWYTAMDTGLVEGFITHDAAALMFGLIPLLKHKTDMGSAGLMMQPQLMIINLDFWNKLPDDLKKVFNDLEPWLVDEIYKVDVGEKEKAMAKHTQSGTKILKLTSSQMEEWYKFSKPLHKSWTDKMTGQGLPAQAVFDKLNQLITTEPADYHYVPSK